jgi:hypothetical protein
MVNLRIKTIWFLIFNFTHCAVVKINKDHRTHQVVFKQIGNYATDVHCHHICILFNLSKIIDTPMKAMKTIETYIKNVYQHSLMYYKDHQRGIIGDKHQAHLAAELIKDTSDLIVNISSEQLVAIKNNLLSITSMLPNSNTRPERQLELIFGLGATLFSLYNYINQNADNSQMSKNTQSISSLTHISEIQEDHLKNLIIEVSNNHYFFLQSLKFSPAI